jgi:hypothetical protein
MAEKREATQEWESYAKDRYESRRGSLVEFRGWARQLMQIVGVVIAIEIALFGKLVDVFSVWSVVPLVALLATVAYQLTLLDLARAVGYSLTAFKYPESPTQVPVARSGRAMRRAIARQYSLAYEERNAESSAVGPRVADLGRGFIGSLFYGLMGTLLLTLVTLSVKAYVGRR